MSTDVREIDTGTLPDRYARGWHCLGPVKNFQEFVEYARRAKELESLEAVICLHCGYNTVTRQREASRAVHEATGEDKFHWWLPGILCCVGILVTIGLCIFCCFKTRAWMKDGWFWDDEKPENPYMVKPGCFMFGAIMLSLFICLALGRFAYRRLVLDYKPPERDIVKDKDMDD